MYTYRFYNVFSTKASPIVDDTNRTIGSVARYYESSSKRIVDKLLKGRIFVNYQVTDANQQVVFLSKKATNPFNRRQYHLSYFKNNEEHNVHLIDQKTFDLGETTTFDYNGGTYELIKQPLEKAIIKKDGTLVAEWDNTMSVPSKAHFELRDEDYKEDELFFLGVFHTYFHAG
ncbi:tubby C-terminal domain-like protein [Pontibacillus halophilus]|uniref:tubby C-terminal domain-like protein n=1 Tax=Pontibacillus halophilus TaxID=516704 RepID=UPI003B82E9DC